MEDIHPAFIGEYNNYGIGEDIMRIRRVKGLKGANI